MYAIKTVYATIRLISSLSIEMDRFNFFKHSFFNFNMYYESLTKLYPMVSSNLSVICQVINEIQSTHFFVLYTKTNFTYRLLNRKHIYRSDYTINRI